jgi:hypothetical protein
MTDDDTMDVLTGFAGAGAILCRHRWLGSSLGLNVRLERSRHGLRFVWRFSPQSSWLSQRRAAGRALAERRERSDRGRLP